MDSSYTLGKNKKLFELAEFPAINPGDKVGILYTGGIKSSLVARIAKEIYGIDNIVFLLITMEQFSNFKNNKKKLACTKRNFENGIKRIEGKHTLDINNKMFSRHEPTASYAIKKLLSKFNTLKYVFSGHSNIHEESINMLTDAGWEQGLVTKGQLPEYLKNNSKKYKELSYYVENLGCPIYFTSDAESFEFIKNDYLGNVRPLRNLEFHEIMELYNKIDTKNELKETTSCDANENDIHCGKCKNCVQRKYAFSKSGVKDSTKYSFNS
jgi:hypothetical protein